MCVCVCVWAPLTAYCHPAAYARMQGGWCFTPPECRWRALNDPSGTTNNYTRVFNASYWGYHGITDSAPAANPDFHTFNVAYFIYCDGQSFSGNRPDSITQNGTKLWFRGARVLDALLDDLLDSQGQ